MQTSPTVNYYRHHYSPAITANVMIVINRKLVYCGISVRVCWLVYSIYEISC